MKEREIKSIKLGEAKTKISLTPINWMPSLERIIRWDENDVSVGCVWNFKKK